MRVGGGGSARPEAIANSVMDGWIHMKNKPAQSIKVKKATCIVNQDSDSEEFDRQAQTYVFLYAFGSSLSLLCSSSPSMPSGLLCVPWALRVPLCRRLLFVSLVRVSLSAGSRALVPYHGSRCSVCRLGLWSKALLRGWR